MLTHYTLSLSNRFHWNRFLNPLQSIMLNDNTTFIIIKRSGIRTVLFQMKLLVLIIKNEIKPFHYFATNRPHSIWHHGNILIEIVSGKPQNASDVRLEIGIGFGNWVRGTRTEGNGTLRDMMPVPYLIFTKQPILCAQMQSIRCGFTLNREETMVTSFM